MITCIRNRPLIDLLSGGAELSNALLQTFSNAMFHALLTSEYTMDMPAYLSKFNLFDHASSYKNILFPFLTFHLLVDIFSSLL